MIIYDGVSNRNELLEKRNRVKIRLTFDLQEVYYNHSIIQDRFILNPEILEQRNPPLYCNFCDSN